MSDLPKKPNPGRGRGESSQLARLDLDKPIQRFPGSQAGTSAGSMPVIDVDRRSTGSSGSTGSNSDPDSKTIRGRGGYRTIELRTIPEGVQNTKAVKTDDCKPVDILSNFVRITPMASRPVYKYRIDFEPNVEAVPLRGRLFRTATAELFTARVVFDNMYDARSSHKTEQEETKKVVDHPSDGTKITITIKMVGQINPNSFEMIRLYNLHMKNFLRALGFFQSGQAGAYVHEELAARVGQHELMMVRGFRTAANIHEQGAILMNLESVHKLVQRLNVLDTLIEIRGRGGNFVENAKSQLIGKLVLTRYNKTVYRIEGVEFNKNPSHTFDQNGQPKSYVDYYRSKYNVEIKDKNQPLLLVVPNNARKREANEEAQNIIYLIPELCNIAGLTEPQRNDNRLKMDLIKASQLPPQERVNTMKAFMEKLNNSSHVQTMLEQWNYSYDKEPIKLRGRILPLEAVGNGRNIGKDPRQWPRVDNMGSFDGLVLREALAVKPSFPKMVILITGRDVPNQNNILNKLREGFTKVSLQIGAVDVKRLEQGDSAQHFVAAIKAISADVTAALIIMPQQNKERYDSIKKVASCERGLITQVVTSRLMMDDRKANGAAVKIGIQLAAKVGGEPWHINLPLKGAMICGYDTYHDTANRGRSFGAFLASMNDKFSRWWSKADSHDRLDELSAHLSENVGTAMRAYRDKNGNWPDRVYMYRDGVGDGQLEHVFNVEAKQAKKIVKSLNGDTKFTMIIVNKRIGARFYMRNNNQFINPPPGTVIDDVVTRRERYDFYLISQSTRQGTITPTYYNIIHDESGLPAERHQMVAFKMCFNYYNWSGTVRVPAPCQYAHKLALLCGEHLHQVPNANMNDRLHFL